VSGRPPPEGAEASNAALPSFGDAGALGADQLLAAAIAAAPTGVVISDPRREDCPIAVSYTHLTLPTTERV